MKISPEKRTVSSLKREFENLSMTMKGDMDKIDGLYNRATELLDSVDRTTEVLRKRKQSQKAVLTKIQSIRNDAHAEIKNLQTEFEEKMESANGDVSKLFNITVKKLEKLKEDKLRQSLKK